MFFVFSFKLSNAVTFFKSVRQFRDSRFATLHTCQSYLISSFCINCRNVCMYIVNPIIAGNIRFQNEFIRLVLPYLVLTEVTQIKQNFEKRGSCVWHNCTLKVNFLIGKYTMKHYRPKTFLECEFSVSLFHFREWWASSYSGSN